MYMHWPSKSCAHNNIVHVYSGISSLYIADLIFLYISPFSVYPSEALDLYVRGILITEGSTHYSTAH